MEFQSEKVSQSSVQNEEKVNSNNSTDILLEVDNKQAEVIGNIKSVADSINELPKNFSEFVLDYRSFLAVLGYGTLAIVSVYICSAVIDAIEDIPIIAPLFEIVGLGYVIWFIWRYLFTVSRRQDFKQEVDSIKVNLLGPAKSE